MRGEENKRRGGVQRRGRKRKVSHGKLGEPGKWNRIQRPPSCVAEASFQPMQSSFNDPLLSLPRPSGEVSD